MTARLSAAAKQALPTGTGPASAGTAAARTGTRTEPSQMKDSGIAQSRGLSRRILFDELRHGACIRFHHFAALRHLLDVLVAVRALGRAAEGFLNGGFEFGGERRFEADERPALLAVRKTVFEAIGSAGDDAGLEFRRGLQSGH